MLEDLASLLAAVTVPPEHEGPVRAAVQSLEAGRPDDAARTLEGLYAGSNGGRDAVVAWLLGVAHLARADVYRAGPALDAALSQDPDLWPAHYTRALVLEILQDFEAAAEALRRVLQVRAEHVGAIAALARCYTELGKLDRAEALARRGLELAPQSLALLRALAGTLRKHDRHADAVEVLRRALALAPADESSAVALGRSLLRLYRAAEAQPIFEDVLRRNSESTGALAGMAEALQSEGRFSEAQGYLLRALAAAPDQGWLHLLHARLQTRMGNAVAAESSANMAATLEPLEPEALRIGIWACREQRRFDDAAAYGERLLALVPEDPAALAARAMARVLAGEAAAVLSELTPRLVGDKTPPDLMLAVGCAQFALGRPRQAADLFVQVLRHRERDALAQRLVGWAYELVSNPTADALHLLRVRLSEAEPSAHGEHPSGARRSESRTFSSEAARTPTRRMTGSIQPIVEVAVNALLAPERTGGAIPRPPSGRGHTPAPAEPPPRRGTGSMPAIAVLSPTSDTSGVDARVTVGEPDSGGDSQPGGEAVSVLTHVGEREISDLREALRRLHRLLDTDSELMPVAMQVERLIEDLDQPMKLAILGPQGSGKTSFVNALIGREVIPPATRIAHLLRYGRHPVGRILYRDGRIETVRFQDLTGFLSLNATELTPDVVQLVEILYPIEELTRASILDVPEAALERRDDPLLAEADAIIWLVGVDQPAQLWKDAARWLADRPTDAIAIVSRVEGHDALQIDSAVSRARMLLAGRAEDVLPVSAKVALAALRTKNVNELRRSGIARLHRVLKRQFFQRSAWIKANAGRARARKLLAQAVGLVEDRHSLVQERQTLLAALIEQVNLDRAQIRAEIEEDTPPRLRAAVENAVDLASRDLAEILRENRGGAGREYVLRAIRARVREAVGDAVDRVREVVDARLTRLLEGYMERLDEVWPQAEGSTHAQRILGLHGLLDSFRQIVMEQSFGRYVAYLEGWVDQSNLAALFELLEGDPAQLTQEALTHALRTRALRLEAAPPIVLAELAEPLFEGIAGFAEEALGELRASALELTKALREPLRAINLREQERS